MDNKTMVKLWNLILEKTKGYDNESGGKIIDFENGLTIGETDIENWCNEFNKYIEDIDFIKDQYEDCECTVLEKALNAFYEKEGLTRYLDYEENFFWSVDDYVIAKAKEVEEKETVIRVDKGFCREWNPLYNHWEAHISYENSITCKTMSEAKDIYYDKISDLEQNEYISIEVDDIVICTEYGRNS